MLRALQFGTTGQLSRELLARAAGRMNIQALSREAADLSRVDVVRTALRNAGKVDLVIFAAAYTAVDRAEQEPDLAHAVNAVAPGAMADICADKGIPLVHVSTDYVFDGSGSAPWTETDPTNPLGVYGASKLAGEQAIAASGCEAAILRTSWVFSPHGANFVKTMLRLGSQRPELRVVDDQIGCPTYAGDLAEAVLVVGQRLVERDAAAQGLFHFAGTGACSWRQFAEAIFEANPKGPRPTVVPIRSEDYPTPAARPRNSVLSTAKIANLLGVEPPSWRPGLFATLEALDD
jgi:dTDP-4-dehydrorhamnose reductase